MRATSTYCLSFSGCWRCSANGHPQNALLFLHHKENALCYVNSHKNALCWQQYPGILRQFTH